MRSRENEHKNDTKTAIDLFENGGRYEALIAIIVHIHMESVT
jgi:hypothetical protein